MGGKAEKHYIKPHYINGVLMVWTDLDLQSIADKSAVPVLFFNKKKEEE